MSPGHPPRRDYSFWSVQPSWRRIRRFQACPRHVQNLNCLVSTPFIGPSIPCTTPVANCSSPTMPDDAAAAAPEPGLAPTITALVRRGRTESEAQRRRYRARMRDRRDAKSVAGAEDGEEVSSSIARDLVTGSDPSEGVGLVMGNVFISSSKVCACPNALQCSSSTCSHTAQKIVKTHLASFPFRLPVWVVEVTFVPKSLIHISAQPS